MKLKIDSLHYALLAVVVLLAVYAFGSFKEGATLVALKSSETGKVRVPRGVGDGGERFRSFSHKGMQRPGQSIPSTFSEQLPIK